MFAGKYKFFWFELPYYLTKDVIEFTSKGRKLVNHYGILFTPQSGANGSPQINQQPLHMSRIGAKSMVLQR